MYGRDHKPPSQAGWILLLGIFAAIVVVAFVWTTYDPKTLMLLNGVRPQVVKMQRSSEPPLIDAKPRSGLDNKKSLR
jgi:hypothetical protein